MSGQNTGQLLGAIAGAALAYFTGGASYVALGATLGGAVGSLLDPAVKTEGPRLEDLKVQFSSYGVGIPRIDGTERVGGNVIWSTDKLEIPTITSAGGKGGGGTDNTSYKYYVHMSLLLMETPVDLAPVSIVKFYQDGKLIWDASSGIPVGSALASAENPYSAFELFQGHPDQLPDPIEESWTGGPGSCSAYRGVVRIRMIAVECPGGRVPQFSFVLSNTATVGVVKQELFNTPDTHSSVKTIFGLIGASNVLHTLADINGAPWPRQTTVSFGESGSVTPVRVWGQVGGYDPLAQPPSNVIPIVGDRAFIQLAYATSGDFATSTTTAYRINAETGETTFLGRFQPVSNYDFAWAAFDVTSGSYVLVPTNGSGRTTFTLFQLNSLVGVELPKPPDGFGPTAFDNGVIHMMKVDGTQVTSMDTDGVVLYTLTLPGTSATLGPRLMFVNDSNIYALVRDTGGAGFGFIFKWTITGYEVVINDLEIPGSDPQYWKTFYVDDSIAIVGPSLTGSTMHYDVIRFNAVTLVPCKVSDIIAAECELSDATAYDVSGIPDSDTVIGYKRANPASARANIEPLLTLIGGFIVDEDNVTKFKKYANISSVASISFNELGQAEGNEAADAMPLSRAQEVDLPRSVTTSYIEWTNDYQTASEAEVRQVTSATEDVQIQLPVCVTSDQARKVSQMVLYDQWRRQNTRTTTVSRKYAFVSPGDGVTVEYPRGTFKLCLLVSTNDTGVVCEWSLCPGDASIFSQTATGATGYTSQEVAALASPTRMLLLDSPIMRDEDNNAGLYVAAEGYGPSWRGYTLWIGDDDSNLQDRGTVTVPCPIGFAESALGVWTPNIIDSKNSVVVSMGDDALVSTTEAALMTSRVNLALIGDNGRWEAIQYQTASSLGSGRYLIYGLLRGLFGTERYTGTHQAGDNFVVITPAAMLRPSQDVGSIGSTRSYRAVSLGRSLDSAASQRYANTAVGLLPYSPWDARKSAAASNDQTITWQRRSRLSTNAFRGIVPLGETTERYLIEFYTSSAFTTLAGTLTSTTKTVTITSAQQTSFGLTPGATLYVHIRQVSDSIGAGTPLEATL